MTKRNDRHDDFEARLRDRLAERANAVDDDSLRELRLARHRALDELDRGRWSPWLPLGAMAASAAIVTAVVLLQGGEEPLPGGGSEMLAQADDLEMMMEGEDLEMLEELEFFEWIEQSNDAG